MHAEYEVDFCKKKHKFYKIINNSFVTYNCFQPSNCGSYYYYYYHTKKYISFLVLEYSM